MSNTSPEQDSALQELARDPGSRKEFLRKMGGGVAATSAFGLFLAACGGDDDSNSAAGTTTQSDTAMKEESGDLAIVNYALTLEYLETAFYADVASSGLFKGAQLEMIKMIGEQEQAHVSALEATARNLGTPAAKPQTKFPLDSANSVLGLAATVENLGAAAYLGQAAKIQSKEILAAALAIHSVEARHAAALNQLTGKSFVPDGAFAAPASMDEVLAAVKPFIVS